MSNEELCKAAMVALEEARTKGWNVLTADVTITGLSEWHVPIVETVTLDPDPIHGGDIYIQTKSNDESKQKYAISRQGLSKLAVAAAIIWSANDTRRTDKRTDRNYVSFQAVGGLKKPDGTYAFMKAEYDLDMEVVEEELTNTHTATAEKFNKGAKYTTDCVKRDMLQKRKNKLKLCESGAKDRVIRELLRIKATYSLAQITKPFVLLRITVRPDYSDKDVKRAMLAAAISSMAGIYGGSAPAQIPYDGEAIDITPEEEAPDAPPPQATPENGSNGGDNGGGLYSPLYSLKSEKENFAGADPAVLDFQNSDDFGQCQSLTNLANKKGYNLADFQNRAKKTIGEMEKAKREGLFKHLMTLADKGAFVPATEPDDIPY